MTNFNPASTSDKYFHYLKIDPMAEQLQLLGVLIREGNFRPNKGIRQSFDYCYLEYEAILGGRLPEPPSSRQ